MTQAFSKVLVRQRPLLALAVIAALLAAAVAVIAPSRAANPASDVTWSIDLGLLDGDGDGIIRAGDNPTLQIVLSASITPDSADQAAGEMVAVANNAITLSSGFEIGDSNDGNSTKSTRLTIAAGSGIRFQPNVNDPNTQQVRVDDDNGAQNRYMNDFTLETSTGPATDPWTVACADTSRGNDSSGSTPAVATCVINTNILVVIPAGTADGSYRIAGNVEFDGIATVAFEDATDGEATDPESASAGGVSTAAPGGTPLPTAVSYNLVLGARPTIDSSKTTFNPSVVCSTAGVIPSTGPASGTDAKACKATIGVNAETAFDLKILNSAGRGVLSGQIATVVITLIRDGEGGTPTFSMCGAGTGTGSTCNPSAGDGNKLGVGGEDAHTTANFRVQVKAPRTPGAATLRALVVPQTGDTLTLTNNLVFIGAADDTKYVISDATSTVLNRNAGDTATDTTKDTARHIITLGLTTADSRDQSVPVPSTVTYEVMDPNGKKSTEITASHGFKADGPDEGTEPDIDRSKVRIVVGDTAAPFQATGAYTLNVKRGSRTVATTTFQVVGPTDSASGGLTVTADTSAATTIGTEVPITIEAIDAEENNVADGTRVQISVSDIDAGAGNVLVLSGAQADGTVLKSTKNGRATAMAIVVGSGRAVLTVSVIGTNDEASTDLSTASAHQVLNLEAITAVAAGTPTDGLTRTDLGQYASWMDAETTTAAALFNQLSRRGATAVYLFNGSEWVQYAAVAGQRIPGARDFTVKQGDTIFIGG